MDWHYHPLAEEELGEAAVFYGQRTARIGDEFLDEVDIAIGQLLTHPESGAVYEEGTRRIVLNRFPFSLVYWLLDQHIVILAVMHQSRKPGYWRDRISN